MAARSARADAVLDQAVSLDLHSRGGFRPTTLRWALFHLIEETARHVGHMDITREMLDGSLGRQTAVAAFALVGRAFFALR